MHIDYKLGREIAIWKQHLSPFIASEKNLGSWGSLLRREQSQIIEPQITLQIRSLSLMRVELATCSMRDTSLVLVVFEVCIEVP